MNCRNCGNQITKFFSLGDMPLVNSFLEKEEISSEKKFDLSVGFCPQCFLVQLMQTVPPEDLFQHYLYFSSTSSAFLAHCKETADYLTKRFSLSSQSLVLEIASNDGAQLQFFKEKNIKVLGVDPAKNIAEFANKKGIPTIPEFFNSVFAQKFVLEKETYADIIFGANVLAHVPEIVDFLTGVKIVLKPKGAAIFEFPYIKGLMENKFDTIYHEHVFYYSLIALRNLFESVNLKVYDAEMTWTQGGSLRIFASHPGAFRETDTLKNIFKKEIDAGFDKIETYQGIEKNASRLKNELISLLGKLKNEGKSIAAYSAPAKGNVLLNYFGVGDNFLDFIVDYSKAKQGFYTPGTHLLVYPLGEIYKRHPDYLLVLCWNIIDEVVGMAELEEYKKKGGKFIKPIPEIKVL